MAVSLTANAIPAVKDGDVNLKPLVQVLDIKPIGSSLDRYRILISDGVLTEQAILAAQLSDRVRGGKLRRGSVVQLVEYICSTVQNKAMKAAG
ncbi:Rpa1ap [Asimina triloba]